MEHVCKSKLAYPPGIKWTKQRKDVYHVLLGAREPLSPAQIYQLIAVEGEMDYAVSTIYRILATFEEKGMVNKSVCMTDGSVVYEWNKGGHKHYAICLGCHKRVALPSCPFEQLNLDIKTDDFQVTSHKLELYGYCKECAK